MNRSKRHAVGWTILSLLALFLGALLYLMGGWVLVAIMGSFLLVGAAVGWVIGTAIILIQS